MLPLTDLIPPIQITDQTMDFIMDEVVQFGLTDETALAIVGLTYPDRVVVNGVLRPHHHEIQREYAHIHIGGENLGDSMEWLHLNWVLQKKYNSAPQDANFSFLFYGHKHPGEYGVYSSTDVESMRKVVSKGLEIAIGPLVTVSSNRKIWPSRRLRGALEFSRRIRATIRFYVLTKAMHEEAQKLGRLPDPVLITPEIIPAASVPPPPVLAWHLSSPDHFKEQIRHLKDTWKCQVTPLTRDTVKGPPYEFLLFVSHPSWKENYSLLIETQWDFPNSEPIFKLLTPAGVRLLTNEETGWKAEMDFLEVVIKLEREGVLK